VEQVTIASEGADVPARLYVPRNPAAPGTLVWFHGGGWVIGSLDSFDHVCRALANAAGARVLSVGYRLAPEDRWPAAVHDADAALQWAARELDGPLVVGGDSAGGNVATVAARRARDAGGPQLAAQLLVYPVCDAAMDTPTYDEFGTDHYLTREAMSWFFAQYVGEGGDPLDPDVSPLRAPDLAGMPPSFVLVAGADPLCDEGRAYAARLAEAGVPVELEVYEDMIHGFLRWTGMVDRSREAIDALGAAARQALAASAG
jgi:acetyl esterase